MTGMKRTLILAALVVAAGLAPRAQMRVVPVDTTTVLHHRSSSPVRLWRQYAEYGRGARRLARLRESAGQPPVRTGRGFPGALARSTLRAARQARSPAVVPLVGLTQAATLWGYATCRR